MLAHRDLAADPGAAGDLGHGEVGAFREALGGGDALVEEPAQWSRAGGCGEVADEGARCHAGVGGQVGDRERFVEVPQGVLLPELLVRKSVSSAFYGEPDLDDWLKGAGVRQIVIAGIQTNMRNETTARMGGNLGHDVLFPLDAMHTFDLAGPFGWSATADELTRATAVSLHGGRFARVVSTEEVVAAAR
ncbi:hypothetical protein SUDANB66_02726 [Streptomyces sp. SudanB66_2053]